MRDRLRHEVGNYLHNTIRQRGLTCLVCTTPVDQQYERCHRCQDDHRQFGTGLADLVVPISYAVKDTQSAHDMIMYKAASHAAKALQTRLTRILMTMLTAHEMCIADAHDRRTFTGFDAYSIVPSTTGRRTGPHPLEGITRRCNIGLPIIQLRPVIHDAGDRNTGTGRFTLVDPDAVHGRHILLVEDTWTTGGRCQSAALALRHAGAATVTTVVLARYLRLDHPRTHAFDKNHLTRSYDPMTCPVPGSSCATPGWGGWSG